ncbi:MAG TPA: ATP-binding protein, partial [Thermodesulfovibrionales bacterium]|nr:ATP-binding protein [Thermodesulfovibrionales bacterium]
RQFQKFLRDPAAVINCLEDAILLLDKRTTVIFINKTAEEFLGKSQREIIGKKLGDLLEDAGAIVKLAQKAIKESRSFSAKEVEVKMNGLSRVDLRISPFFVDETYEGALLSIRENVSIIEKDDSSFDSLVYLLGSIAHEIKNPLGGIKGAAQLLRRRLLDLEREKGAQLSPCFMNGDDEYLNLIIRETDRLNAVLQSYLTMSRRPALHPINIHEVIEKAISIMNISCEHGKIVVHRFYDPSLPRVLGDEGKLLQVFVNIIKNGVEAMPRGGDLSIVTKPSNEYAVQDGQTKRWALISVGDTGSGIPKHELQKIFLPFYTKKKRGTGLGLALSKKIIKDHNGFVKVESPPPSGKGTAFHLYIPFS